MRHRIASYNEESSRYKKLEAVFYKPRVSRPLTQVGKPGAYKFEVGSLDQLESVSDNFDEVCEIAYFNYESMLNDEGVAREVARMILPVNIFTSFYCTINLRSLMNFLSLRSAAEGMFPSMPLYEIAMVADQMEGIFGSLFPVTYAAFIDGRRVAP